MKRETGTIMGAAVGGAAAVAAHIVAGPIGGLILSSTLVTIDASARLGMMVAEACEEGTREFKTAIHVG